MDFTINELILFVFTYVICPLILTCVHLKQIHNNEDHGYFDIMFSGFILYLIIALIYNLYTGDGLKYMVGLTVFIATKDCVISYEKGRQKNVKFQEEKYK